jgi:hypothetical protein
MSPWESLEAVSRVHAQLKTTTLVLGVMSALLTVSTVIVAGFNHRYSNRKDELKAWTGTVVLETWDKYTGQKLSGVICTTADGEPFHPPHPKVFPLGDYKGTCTLTGYLNTPVEWKIHHGQETRPRVEMEQETGFLAMGVEGDDGGPIPIFGIVSIDGDPPMTFTDTRTRVHPAGKVLRVKFLAGELPITRDGVTRHTKWAENKQTITIRGGVENYVKFVVPVVFRDRENP